MEQNNISTAQNPSDGFSKTLNDILSNPQLLSMIGSMAQQLKSSENVKAAEVITATSEKEDTIEKASEPLPPKLTDSIATLAPLLSSEFSKRSKADDKKTCLLRALKPYMSDGRKEAIEYIIKFSMISDVLKNLSI